MAILLSCHLQIILELQFSTGAATSFSRASDVNHYELPCPPPKLCPSSIKDATHLSLLASCHSSTRQTDEKNQRIAPSPSASNVVGYCYPIPPSPLFSLADAEASFMDLKIDTLI